MPRMVTSTEVELAITGPETIPAVPAAKPGSSVLAQNVVRLSKSLVETIGKHGARPVDGLLGGLPDQYERTVPLVFELRQQAGHADASM